MAKIYVVINHGKLAAAFTLSELAEEYANEKMIEDCRKRYKYTNHLSYQGNLKVQEDLKHLGLPYYQFISEYDDNQLLQMMGEITSKSCVVKEVELFA